MGTTYGVRNASLKDIWDIYNLRYSQDNLVMFEKKEIPCPEDHFEYVSQRISEYSICELNSKGYRAAVGFFRLKNIEMDNNYISNFEPSVCIHSAHRKKGLGKKLLTYAQTRIIRKPARIWAKGYKQNIASKNLFLSCGFTNYLKEGDENFFNSFIDLF